jgi:hypothetical protein
MAAQITGISPVASVSYADALALLTTQVPASSISSILLSSQAELDKTGRYRIVFESLQMQDAAQLILSKTAIDSIAATDFVSSQTVKNLIDTTFGSDVLSLVFTRPLQDQAGLSDAGYLLFQNYCDITYFSEDYVGTSRTF